MHRLFNSLSLCLAITASAQTGLVEFPYNPDANGDDIIGVADLLELLGLFGSEFSEENLYLNSDSTSAIYHVTGSWNFGMCAAKCADLPSGKWKMLDFSTWTHFHNEIEIATTSGANVAWISDKMQEIGWASANTTVRSLGITGDNDTKGQISAYERNSTRTCICSLQQRPKVEYFVYSNTHEGLAEMGLILANQGWYPLGSATTLDAFNVTQAFWRWAE